MRFLFTASLSVCNVAAHGACQLPSTCSRSSRSSAAKPRPSRPGSSAPSISASQRTRTVEGWELLLQVTGFRRPAVAAAESTAARDAAVEIDAWDEPNFRLIRAALDRRHPEQSLFVFEGLTASTGAGAVLGVATLLDRLDALEKSPERKATRKADQAALDTLAKRGIPTAERARLRALVTTAMTAAKSEEDASDAADDGEPNEALLKLHAWYGEWSEVARAVIKRRDHLIRLGLAKRKKTAKGAAGTPA